MIDKCIKIYDDNINLYKFEPRSPGMVLVGGYSAAEIESFTHVDLASVLKLFAAKGKVCGTAHCASDMSTLRKHDPSLNSFAQQASSPERVYTDALDIYERCPSATLLNDHSIVL